MQQNNNVPSVKPLRFTGRYDVVASQHEAEKVLWSAAQSHADFKEALQRFHACAFTLKEVPCAR